MPRPALSREVLGTSDSAAATPLAISKKKKKIPRKISQAIDLLVSGECKTQKAAAERVNMTPEHLSRVLGSDHVRAVLRERVSRTLASGTARAAARILELVDCESSKVALAASQHVLAIDGLAPIKQPGININNNVTVSAGYILNMTGRAEAELKPIIDAQCDTAAT